MKTESKNHNVFRRVAAVAVAILALHSTAHAVQTLAPAGTPLNVPRNYTWDRMTTINVYSGQTVPFVVYQINTFGKPAGNYTFTMNTVGFPGAINTYQNGFNPNVPNANFYDNGVVANSAGTISQTINIPANSLFDIVFSAKSTGDAGTFSATVSGPGNVNITTVTNIQILYGPANKTIAAGASTSLRVYANGPLPHKFQWYSGSSPNTGSPISGATNFTYFTPFLNNSTSYWVKVTGPAGAGSANSGTAAITVTGNPGALYSGTLNVGGCQLQNGDLFAVQRFEIQTAGTYTFNLSPGFTGTTYQGVFDPVHPLANKWGPLNGYYAAGTYDLVISKASPGGAFSGSIGGGPAIVNLLSPLPPMFLSSPVDTTISPGQTATLKVSTTCGTPFTLQWYRGESGDTNNPMAGATGFNFTTPALAVNTKYWTRMTYAGGQTDSGAATVYVTAGPISASGTFTACDRKSDNAYYKTFVFSISQDGNYTFTANGGNLRLYQGIFSPQDPNLNLYGTGAGPHTLLSGSGKYYLVISTANAGNPWNVTVSGPALVTLTPAPAITTPPTNVNVFLNQTTTLNVVSPTAGVSYQWYIGSDCGNKFPISGANSNSFTTPPVTDYTNYCVELTTPGGYVFSPMVTVGVMPQAMNDSASTPEDTTKQQAPAGILVNDTKAISRTLKVVNVQFPLHGSVTVTTNGGYTYFPESNFNGMDSFKYRVTDGILTSAVATVSINVTPVNDPPAAGWDYRQTAFQTPLALKASNLLTNDGDADGDPITLIDVSPVSALGAAITFTNGTVFYNPLDNFGSDSFEYTIKDSNGATGKGMVFVSIPMQDFVKLRIVSLNATNCHLQLLGHANHGYWIKWAPAPNGPWTNLQGVMTEAYGAAEIDDPIAPQPATRFYRAVDMDVE